MLALDDHVGGLDDRRHGHALFHPSSSTSRVTIETRRSRARYTISSTCVIKPSVFTSVTMAWNRLRALDLRSFAVAAAAGRSLRPARPTEFDSDPARLAVPTAQDVEADPECGPTTLRLRCRPAWASVASRICPGPPTLRQSAGEGRCSPDHRAATRCGRAPACCASLAAICPMQTGALLSPALDRAEMRRERGSRSPQRASRRRAARRGCPSGRRSRCQRPSPAAEPASLV